MGLLKNIISFCLVFATYLPLDSNSSPKDIELLWKTRFESFLHSIEENSIKNHEWTKADWQKYRDNQLKQLPITDKQEFNNAVINSLRSLEDSHSFLILKDNSIRAKAVAKPLITLEKDGIGIISLPTLMIENVDQQDELLLTSWVTGFHKKLEEVQKYVTKGWVIDLTENEGGSMYPMIAALSFFYKDPALGGFYVYGPDGSSEEQKASFDGKSFFSNGEAYLSYDIAFPFNQNTLPIVVLIGSKTASSAEFVALALQRQPQITLIGQPSYGLATVNAAMELPDNLGHYMPSIGYCLNTRDQPLFAKRVIPQVIVKEDKQILLQRAKDIILNQQPQREKVF